MTWTLQVQIMGYSQDNVFGGLSYTPEQSQALHNILCLRHGHLSQLGCRSVLALGQRQEPAYQQAQVHGSL